MKKLAILSAMVFMVALMAISSANAEVLGNGSAITDCLQIGEVTKLGNRTLTLATKFEEKSKSYDIVLHPDGYVMTAKRADFKKFAELKKGDLVAAYGYYDGKQWSARRIDILDPNDYLVKRLEADAKAGFYYKHERVK